MYYVSYEKGTGRLLQVTEFEPTNVNAELTTFLGDVPDLSRLVWDASALVFRPKLSILSKVDFLKRFTMSERIITRTTAETDPIVVDIFHILNEADEVDLTDPETVAGIRYLQSIGVLSEARASQILGV